MKELGDPDRLANLDLTIWGDNLHAPIIERIVELPMDIYAGALRITLPNVLLHAFMWVSLAQSCHLLAFKRENTERRYLCLGQEYSIWRTFRGTATLHISKFISNSIQSTKKPQRLKAVGNWAGRVNGKLRISANDKETWKFPAIRGRVRGSDLAFHFFDAPDDFSRTKLDLIFEGDRLYFHGAQGFFGAVPITLNGDTLGTGIT